MRFVSVGDLVRVEWSNLCGYSVYRVEDSEKGPHAFVLIEEHEYEFPETEADGRKEGAK